MPRMNGLEFLTSTIREPGDHLTKVVIVTLTMSREPKANRQAAEFAIGCTFTEKSVTVDKVRTAARLLREHRSAV